MDTAGPQSLQPTQASTQSKNVRNLSIKEFFASRLMRTKSFEAGGSNSNSSSPRDDSSNWFDDFKARMSKRAQAKQNAAPSNLLDETNDEPSTSDTTNSDSSAHKAAKNLTNLQQHNNKSDDTTRPLVKDVCDPSSTNFSKLENISESDAPGESPQFSNNSSSFVTTSNLRPRKITRISCTDRPDFDTASINTILNRRDSRYTKFKHKIDASLKSKLLSATRCLVSYLIPFNYNLPWKLFTFVMFALLVLLTSSIENQEKSPGTSNFFSGFLVGMIVACCCSIILAVSLIFHFLPRTVDSDATIPFDDFLPKFSGYGDITHSLVDTGPLDVNNEHKSGDYMQYEVLGEDMGDSHSNDILLEDENYNGWMIEFIGDYELRNKTEVKLKLTYVKIENKILHLCKPKNSDAETAANPVFIHQRTYDLNSVSNFTANLLLPKNVRNRQKWIWSKKYPIKLRFNEFCSKAEDAQKNLVQLTLFAKSCREKEEWFRRFKLIVQENRLAQINHASKRASLQLDSTYPGDKVFPEISTKWHPHSPLNVPPRSVTVQTSQSSHMLNDEHRSLAEEYVIEPESSSNLARTKSCEILHGDEVGSSIFEQDQSDREKFMSSLHPKEDSTLTRESAEMFSQALEESRFLESIQHLNYRDYIQVVIESTKNATSTSDWFNSLIGRIFFDVFSHDYWSSWFKKKIQRKLYRIKLPYFMETLTLTKIELGTNAPQFLNVSSHSFDSFGLSIDFDMAYSGGLTMTFGTKLNLLKIKSDNSNQSTTQTNSTMNSSVTPNQTNDNSPKDSGSTSETSSEVSNKALLRSFSSADGAKISGESSDSEDSDSNSSTESSYDEADPNEISDWEDYNAEKTRQSIVRFVDKIASSRYFQHATENRYIKKKLQDISNCPLVLVVKIESLSGILTVNVPPPQTDRIWYGFKPNPELTLKALPKMGDREVNLSHVTDWIEKKLAEEFRKILVIPNMEDIVLPILKSDHLMYVASTK